MTIMIMKAFIIAATFCVSISAGHIDERFWGTVQDGRLIHTKYSPAVFEKHPTVAGRRIDEYPALKLYPSGDVVFGAAASNQEGDYCAIFESRQIDCTQFRILVDVPGYKFRLVAPENIGQNDDIVEYFGRRLVIANEPETESSFFGTFESSTDTVTYINSKDITVSITGSKVTTGEYILYVVAPKL